MRTLPSTIRYATGHCNFGAMLLGVCDTGICAILLGDDDEQMVADLQQRFPQAELLPGQAKLADDMDKLIAYVDHPGGQLELESPLAPFGSDFQRQVWAQLNKVPAGQTITYAELATRIGKPTAIRAVAGACAANPLAIIVPCHRVLRSDGGISGYRWGVARKQQLIELERRIASAG